MTRAIYTYIEFTEAAKKLLDGESDVIGFNWAVCPNVGDIITIIINNKTLTFSCKSRHFDLTKPEESKLTINLDVA